MLAITLAFALYGYFAGGKEGLTTGLTLGLLLSLMATPMLALLIGVNVWSGYASRWGEANYKEMLEGKPGDKKYDD
jgi:hypothetical protein